MKRLSAGLVVAVVVAAGAMTSACNVAPTAATVNGDPVTIADLNTQLQTIDKTAAGRCLLQLQYPNVDLTDIQGTGGTGTYATDVATAVLNDSVSDLVSAQYAAAHGLHLTSADLSQARNELTSDLQGEISNLEGESGSSAAVNCLQDGETAFTGSGLLDALPASMRNDQIAGQAVNQRLLAQGANLSVAAVLNYYAAHQSEFTVDCVSRIVVASQATANSVVDKLRAGATFASLAESTSIDTETASSGGALGCQFTESEVLQDLGQTSVTVDQPVTQSSDGSWEIFEITSRTVVPVTSAESTVREYLEQQTSNVNRVEALLKVFAHRSTVWVNPQYGSWKGVTISVPVPPSTRYLQPTYIASSAAATSAAG